MKKISLFSRQMLGVVALTVLLIVADAPAVSADELVNEHLSFYIDSSVNRSEPVTTTGVSGVYNFDRIHLKKIENHKNMPYFSLIIASNQATSTTYMSEGRHTIEYTLLGQTKPCVVYCQHYKNILGQTTSAVYTIFPQDWDIGTGSGPQYITFSEYLFQDRRGQSDLYIHKNYEPDKDYRQNYDVLPCTYANQDYFGPWGAYKIVVSSFQSWENNLLIETSEPDLLHVTLEREIGGKGYESDLTLTNNGTVTYYHTGVLNFEQFFPPSLSFDTAILTDAAGNNYTYYIGGADPGGDPGTDPGDPGVTVYVKNSQTGALIANANIVIDALVNGEYYTVANKTEPSGIFSITLQPTGGGQPNPDGYRLIATADGYNNPMPEINFTVDDYKKYIYCLLDPIAGGPENENNTFIDFFVRDMSANPITGATINFGGYTLITNSAGYTVFEVGKNSTYTYTVSKSGYGSLTGNVVIGADPRHTINTVLAPSVTPTISTPIPTSTSIKPTPTMTAPTGEPVSNWLDWFAAHFGMILGGGVEIGKIFMWLCFSVPVGVYVAKEAKAGAAGFMAGAGVVTLFFVLIGWVPIWLLVLLALIIGLLYAKVFNNSDTGGGR